MSGSNLKLLSVDGQCPAWNMLHFEHHIAFLLWEIFLRSFDKRRLSTYRHKACCPVGVPVRNTTSNVYWGIPLATFALLHGWGRLRPACAYYRAVRREMFSSTYGDGPRFGMPRGAGFVFAEVIRLMVTLLGRRQDHDRLCQLDRLEFGREVQLERFDRLKFGREVQLERFDGLKFGHEVQLERFDGLKFGREVQLERFDGLEFGHEVQLERFDGLKFRGEIKLERLKPEVVVG